MSIGKTDAAINKRWKSGDIQRSRPAASFFFGSRSSNGRNRVRSTTTPQPSAAHPRRILAVV
jgi:hypothetical protein